VATVIEGDFEWDDEKARENYEKHGVSFPEAAVWSSSAPLCAIASSTSFTSSGVVVIASSARVPPLGQNETSMNQENTHDPLS